MEKIEALANLVGEQYNYFAKQAIDSKPETYRQYCAGMANAYLRVLNELYWIVEKEQEKVTA